MVLIGNKIPNNLPIQSIRKVFYSFPANKFKESVNLINSNWNENMPASGLHALILNPTNSRVLMFDPRQFQGALGLDAG